MVRIKSNSIGGSYVLECIPKTTDVSITKIDESEIPPNVKKIITWKCGERVPYKAVVDTFDAVGAISGRLEKESLLTLDFLKLSY